jgi:hypothetical protein
MRTIARALSLLALASGPALAQSPAADKPVDMKAWESQVVGAIFGQTCGYYPDRLTIYGQGHLIKNYAECKALFEKQLKTCLDPLKKSSRWQLGSGAQAAENGKSLGQELGDCISNGLDKATADRRAAADKTQVKAQAKPTPKAAPK